MGILNYIKEIKDGFETHKRFVQKAKTRQDIEQIARQKQELEELKERNRIIQEKNRYAQELKRENLYYKENSRPAFVNRLKEISDKAKKHSESARKLSKKLGLKSPDRSKFKI